MKPSDWLSKMQEELAVLAAEPLDRPADAWRAATLVARLLASASRPAPASELVRRIPELLKVSGLPDPQEILNLIADELDAECEAWGRLMDGLLDADDAVSVFDLLGGHDGEARNLAKHVAALVSLYPDRVMPLGAFAAMRLDSVRSEHPVTTIWRAVERAPALILADSLPGLVHERAPDDPLGRVISLTIPSHLQLAAADSRTEETFDVDTEDPVVKAWISMEDGRMLLEVSGLVGPRASAVLIVERETDKQELDRIRIELEYFGQTAYATFGPWAGPENLLHQIAQHHGDVSIRVRLAVTDG